MVTTYIIGNFLDYIIYEKKRGRNNNGMEEAIVKSFLVSNRSISVVVMVVYCKWLLDDIYNMLLTKEVCLHACNPRLCEVLSLAIAIST